MVRWLGRSRDKDKGIVKQLRPDDSGWLSEPRRTHAEFVTPGPWAPYVGTCTPLVPGAGTASQTIGCGTTATLLLGGGDGNTSTVRVQARTVGGSCVTSNAVSISTNTYEVDAI
jgi:hypothetical protein